MKIENQNYKILVSTQQEAKEIQKIFFACGYKWAWQRYAEQRDVRLGFFIESFCNDLGLIETTDSDKKEITLPELREFFQKSPWGQIESLKAQLAQVKSTNHSLEEINADLSESLKLLKDKYGNDDYVLIKKDKKTVVAIENMVDQQVEASGIDEPIHRLDGWLILEAMIEAQEQGNE